MHTTRNPLGRSDVWLVAALTLAGLALRLWALGDKGLAYDEAATALMARATPAEIVAFHWRAAFEHPPLWQLTMAAWSALFGQREAMLRLLPALAGAGAVPLTWWWVRRLWPDERGIAGWAAAFVALSPALVLYSQEARMYSVVVALALLSLIAFHGLVIRPAFWPAVAFVFANWLITGYHYYSLLLIGIEGGFLVLLMIRRRQVRTLFVWLAALIVSILPIALWMLAAPGFQDTLRIILASTRGEGASTVAFVDELWRDLSFGSIRWQPEVAAAGYILAPLVAIGLGVRIAADARHPARDFVPWSWLVGLTALLPLAISLVFAPALASRYILFVLPAIYVLAAAAVVWFSRQSIALGLAGAAMVLVVAWMGLSHYFGPYVKSEYREMATFLAAHRREDEAVMLYAPRQHLLARYYLPGVAEFATAPDVVLPAYWPVNAPPVVPEEMDGVIQELLRSHPALWLAVTAEDEVDPGEFIPKYLTAVSYKETCWSWLDVHLCRFLSPHFMVDAETVEPDALLGGELRLERAAVAKPPANEDDAGYVFVRLDWLAEQKPSLDYRVTLRLVDNGGAVVTQRDEYPIGPLLPPSTWNAGEAKPGYMALPLPDNASGEYHLVAGIYDPATGQTIGEPVALETIEP